MKTCTKCKRSQPDTEFVSRVNGAATALCDGCRRAALASLERFKVEGPRDRRPAQLASAALREAGLRKCTKCGEAKVLSAFYVSGSKTRSDCTSCCARYSSAKPGHRPAVHPITCTRCARTLPATEFYRNKNFAKGRRSWCRGCVRDSAVANWPRYYSENRERLLAATEHWRKTNPRKASCRAHRRRSRTFGTGVADAAWAQIVEQFDGRCAYCLARVADPQMDHVESLARGGAHEPENVVPACKVCNASKKARSLLACFAPHLAVSKRMGNHSRD